MKRACVYHAGCPDGFGAAWAVRSAWEGEGKFIARGHEDRLRGEDLQDHIVVFVDIAPDNEEIRDLTSHVARLVVVDHHVTAQNRFEAEPSLGDEIAADGHFVHFDMGHSGAVLAWQHFMPDEPVPDLLRYIEDQDLWAWKLPGSAEVNAAIGSYPHSFDAWSDLARMPVSELERIGASIVRSNRQDVERALRHTAPLAIGRRRVESVNANTNRSAIGHELAKRKSYGEAWGCVYRIVGDQVHATLYSIGDFDVASITTELGGGGHKNAAGFSVGLADWVRDFVC